MILKPPPGTYIMFAHLCALSFLLLAIGWPLQHKLGQSFEEEELVRRPYQPRKATQLFQTEAILPKTVLEVNLGKPLCRFGDE